MEQIADLDTYNLDMSKGIIDKLSFLDLAFDFDTVVDFGCADGNLLKWINIIRPELKLIGYDNNLDMIEIAKKNCPNAKFFSSLEEVKNKMGDNAILNLSSVLHEVYSYCTPNKIDEILNFIRCGFKYVFIRDMSYSEYSIRPTNITDEMKVRMTLKDLSREYQIKDFEKAFGSINIYKNFIHFMLKYNWVENWKRESVENYFSLSTEEVLNIMGNDYTVEYYNRFILPFVRYNVRKDFDIDITDNTHVKVLFKRKENYIRSYQN